MFSRIVVPLDGTRFAEAALVPARELAKTFGARLLLVRAIAPTTQTVPENKSAAGANLTVVYEIDAYLRRILGELRTQGFQAEATLQVAEPGRGITQVAELSGDDVIVMASHVRWQFPTREEASTTLDVLGKARVPILVWRGSPSSEIEGTAVLPPLLTRTEFPLIVPLDGSAFAERALPYAEALAHAFDQYLVLVRVVRSGETQGPALNYLHDMAAKVISKGIPAVVSVREGDPLGEIEKVWRERDGSMIVMASRGNTMTCSGVLGSLAARMIEELEAPMLLIRPQLEVVEQDPHVALEVQPTRM